ncbi:MAG TPA: hypothetical protein VFU43_28875 [Streptosporangiaceae bacterium]|nr:hypothetical protein [Streptosporangiaceae bacterium]
MTRQIALGYGAPSPADLENRIRALETKVAALTKTVALLVSALEEDHSLAHVAEEIATPAREAHALLTEDRPAAPVDEPGPRT